MPAPELLGGRYELRGVLGRGGSAEVRDGWDLRLGHPVAVKVLHPSVSAHPDCRRRFVAEAHAVARLNHPQIVAVRDSGVYHGRYYIVLERLPGQSLADVMARRGPLDAHQVRVIMRDVLAALGAAHRRGVVHRDVKPANILFTRSGRVKIADFGVAKSAETPQTLTNRIFGTMAYLPADRIAGRQAIAGDDLYALGVVAYEALTARRAYPQDSLSALADAISAGCLTPLRTLRPDVDPALAETIERSMARDPRSRFGTAEQMLACLDAPRPKSRLIGGLVAAGVLTVLVFAALLIAV
ncbi:MAG: serine/threonine protein kinase [Actinomycetia bacterium]|nr:serine/threonine protein kinase [Actinomycetes bacterium]MCH9702339.1 serine/threonine protein kinase [Actinomycetes bacterium]MCH9759473.1 serine/threonine protein kinase [Actinomycetes bacterium]